MKKKSKAKRNFAFIILFVILVGGIVGSLVLFINVRYPLKYEDSITKYSQQYSLNKNLVASLINEESSFNKDAVSRRGAMGLMQLSPETARFIASELGEEYDIDKVFDPNTNIRYGCYYLNYLKDKFSSPTAYLSAYNAGETTVKLWQKDADNISTIPYPVTQEYVTRILNGVKVYKGRF